MTWLLYAVFFGAGTFFGALGAGLMMMGRDAEEREEEKPPVMPRIRNGENK